MLIPNEIITQKIYAIRGQKVMIDRDLAELYEVETRALIQAVKRNIDSFPEDFMFQLNDKEFESLISQIVTSNRGGTRKRPYAFTEHGVLMLSGVLKSDRARQVNIQIMRLFTKMREILLTNKDLILKMNQVEQKLIKHDSALKTVFDALKQLIQEEPKPRKEIGYKRNKK